MDGLVVAGGPGACRFPAAIAGSLVADEGLEGHRAYLDGRMALGQFDAMDSLLETLSMGQREFLLFQLLGELKSSGAPSPALLAWVRATSGQGATMAGGREGGRFPGAATRL